MLCKINPAALYDNVDIVSLTAKKAVPDKAAYHKGAYAALPRHTAYKGENGMHKKIVVYLHRITHTAKIAILVKKGLVFDDLGNILKFEVKMTPIDKYLTYIRTERRYSPRTTEIYADVIERFRVWSGVSADDIPGALTLGDIRDYQVHLSEKEKLEARTINQHLSVLSSFCSYLVRYGVLESNPVKQAGRPKVPRRLPSFYRESSMEEYFDRTGWVVDPSTSLRMTNSDTSLRMTNSDTSLRMTKSQYRDLLSRVVISLLFGTGIRRSELIGLQIKSMDFGRNVLHVHGKGNKMREIPIISSLSQELLLYLQATESLLGRARAAEEPLLVTEKGRALYPMAVERIVAAELGKVESIAGRKSPHVLRHTLATELLEKGADLNSIKEMLGHSSLAATQVYTHNTIGQLKNIYNNAHPRAKRGGKNGD